MSMRKKWYWIAPIGIGASCCSRLSAEKSSSTCGTGFCLRSSAGMRSASGRRSALLVLSRILFGRLGGHGAGSRWRRRWEEKYEHLTPEERERFRQGMHGRCGWPARDTAEPASSQTPGQ